MALPLPRVVSDVGPGGPLVTAMGGINSLANDNILRQINQIKKQYLPTTLGAEAASKLAYANLMGPQFLAKLLGSDSAVANMGDPAARAALEKAVGAGMGRNSGMNAFNQMQQGNQGNSMFSGIGEPSTNSFSGHLKNVFRALIGQNPQQGPNQNAFNMPAQNYDNSSNPRVSAEGPGVIPNGDFPFVGREGYRPHPTTTGYDGNQMQVMADDGNASMEMDMTGGQPRQQSDEWGASTPAAQQAFAEGREPTYAEKTGKYKSIVSEGVAEGAQRVKQRAELDDQYQQALEAEVPMQHLNEIIKNPLFQKLRRDGVLQKFQLDSKEITGTPEEKEILGDFRTTAKKALASSIMGWKGRILDKEVGISNSMKVGDNDSFYSILGKVPTIEAFDKMTIKRARTASKLMRDQHISKGDALEQADRFIDGEAIRKKIVNELRPKPTEEDYKHMMDKYKIPRVELDKRLKEAGHI